MLRRYTSWHRSIKIGLFCSVNVVLFALVFPIDIFRIIINACKLDWLQDWYPYFRHKSRLMLDFLWAYRYLGILQCFLFLDWRKLRTALFHDIYKVRIFRLNFYEIFSFFSRLWVWMIIVLELLLAISQAKRLLTTAFDRLDMHRNPSNAYISVKIFIRAIWVLLAH